MSLGTILLINFMIALRAAFHREPFRSPALQHTSESALRAARAK